jgi:tRNA nucleotidyltransferase (CCA-adding enzyme)
MERLKSLDLLKAIHPALTWNGWLEDHWRQIRTGEMEAFEAINGGVALEFLYYAIWMFNLSIEQAHSICQRLQIAGSERDSIIDAIEIGQELPKLIDTARPSQLVGVLEGREEKGLAAAWLCLGEQAKVRSAIEQYLKVWRDLEPHADGNRLREMGLPPGPAYSRILETLRKAWLNGELKDREEEEHLLAELVEAERSHG